MQVIKDSDFIFKGYHKYHLWTGLYFDYLVSPKWQHKTRKERKHMALKVYLELLGVKSAKKMS